jgi:hypothetical protein
MRAIDPGHLYELDNLKNPGYSQLQFYKDAELHEGDGWEGPSTQEVIRACIDRVKVLNEEKPWEGNELIIAHLRSALIGFEIRALERAVEKGEAVEAWPVNGLGHLCGA